MFGCNGKFHFPKIHFLLTNIYSFDPELILHSYFWFKSFSEKEREREREGEERAGAIVRRARRNKTAIVRPALIGRSRPSSIAIASALVDRRARSSIEERRDRLTSVLVDRAASRTIAPISPPISLLPRDLIFSFTARSQFNRILDEFFVGFCFFCECGIICMFCFFIICMFTVEKVCGKLVM